MTPLLSSYNRGEGHKLGKMNVANERYIEVCDTDGAFGEDDEREHHRQQQHYYGSFPSSLSFQSLSNLLWDSKQQQRANRLLSRGTIFNQATGEITVKKKIDTKVMNVMYRVDWFHSLIDLKTYKFI